MRKTSLNKHQLLFIMRVCLFKLMLLFITSSFIYANETFAQDILNRQITVNVKDVSLKTALNKIEVAAKIQFSYSRNVIDLNQIVTCNANPETLANVLQRLLKPLSITYQVVDDQVLLYQTKRKRNIRYEPFIKETSSTEETMRINNEILVTGRVVSATGEPLAGASINVKNTNKYTSTNTNGEFSIAVDNENAVLIVSFTGYDNKEIVVGTSNNISIAMVATNNVMEDVVVVGYGTQRKRSITGSVAQLNTNEVRDMPVPNIGQRLQGKFAGVQINQSNGYPGAPVSFRIRGAASIRAGNSPLIVIDGFPTVSGMQTISPDEIESISVLKDASASSLYGSRAANGVILITTRQAKLQQKSIEFSSYVGFESVPDRGRPDMMNAREFAQFKKEHYEDKAMYEGYTGGVPAEYQQPEKYGPNDGTNWFELLLRRALTQGYNLSLSSGTKDLRSVVNLNYNKQEGVMLNSYAERFTGRANNIYTATDRLTLGLNLGVSYRRSQVFGDAIGTGPAVILNAQLMDPTLNYKNPDGTFPIAFSQPGMFPSPNYYLVLTQRINPVKATTILSNAFAEYKIIKGLQYKFSFNVDMNNTVQRGFTPSTAQGGLGVAPPGAPTGSYGTSSYLSWLAENTMTYQKSINGDHNFEALIGYSSQNTSTENSNINGSQFPDDNIQWLSAATTRLGNVGTTEYALQSYISRLNYNYKSKYLLSLAYRRDGSSRFGRDNQWGNFPSVSMGWIVSDEGFMKNNRHVSFLKLRASWGRVGNDNIGEYTHLSSVATGDYVFNNQIVPGRSLAGIGNAALTWESSSSYNLGLDLDLFKSRISFTYDYYSKKTDGLLYGIDIPRQSGFGSITSNIGRFDFWGHEFSVSSKNLNRGKLKWNTSLNISFDRNMVKALGTNNTPIGGYDAYWDPNRTAVGQPIGKFYGYVFDGIYMTQEELDSQPHEAGAMVGTARYKDVGGPDGKPDGVIDVNDRTFIGNPNPDFIYGITNILSYSAFDLNVVMAGTVGNDIIDDALLWSESPDGIFNVRKGLAGRWRSLENPGEGKYPRTRTGTTGNFYYTSTRQVFDGTYLAIKNITLGYTLPLSRVKGITKARVFFSTQNPVIFTNYPGLNPEVGMAGLNGLNQGRDFSSYPVSRVFTLGINVGF